ncbi:3-oxoacyl-ACP reductase FabG [Metallumcola ferriviriculae]|uniref:3-oxoacyl-ACP reductase FabG n=1 Tax=Metallumcola ferriviriculae TaxID=3039180 RepID=A0AAU0UU73_9FIRM|nr:3-oxoacyl-ACP reductase FabG [Desulfitibacteraceae bacterium MK1]
MLTKKVALVTGAARGLGKAIAEALSDAGAAVCLNDIDSNLLESTAAGLKKKGRKVMVSAVDVADQEKVENMVSETINRFGRLDILVNNAGISPKRDGQKIPFIDMPKDEWARVLDVNLNGMFNCSQAAARAMQHQGGGHIVNISSVSGRLYTALTACHYITTKAAIIGFTRALAGELAEHDIKVNAIAPGRINTEMVKMVSFEVNQKFRNQIPLGTFGEPHHIAQAVTFLVSPAAEYMTGITLDINGGMFMN